MLLQEIIPKFYEMYIRLINCENFQTLAQKLESLEIKDLDVFTIIFAFFGSLWFFYFLVIVYRVINHINDNKKKRSETISRKIKNFNDLDYTMQSQARALVTKYDKINKDIRELFGKFINYVIKDDDRLIVSINTLEYDMESFLRTFNNFCLTRDYDLEEFDNFYFPDLFSYYEIIVKYNRVVNNFQCILNIEKIIKKIDNRSKQLDDALKKHLNSNTETLSILKSDLQNVYLPIYLQIEYKLQSLKIFQRSQLDIINESNSVNSRFENKSIYVKLEILSYNNLEAMKLIEIQENILDFRVKTFKLGTKIVPESTDNTLENFECTFNENDEFADDCFRNIDVPLARMRYYIMRKIYRGRWNAGRDTWNVKIALNKRLTH